MKTKIQSTFLAGVTLGTALLMPALAQAQSNVTPASGGRLAVVDIKDATLKDALDLVFDSAGIKSRSIDASASFVYVPDVVRSNIAWDDLVRSLCLTYDYKFSRNRDGLYVIEPRVPVGFNPDGGEGFPGQGGFPGSGRLFQGQGGFPSRGGFQGGVTSAPANPFGFGGAPQGPRTFGNRQMLPEVQTRSNSQTTPRVGTRGGGRSTTGGRSTDEPLKYTIVRVRHVYSGGIAELFSNGTRIPTELFVTPGQVGGTNGGQGGIGGGQGGFGGGQGSSFGGGGIGGGIGGGGGFGGGGGGFGGGGGGFGGGGGGFGGGGF